MEWTPEDAQAEQEVARGDGLGQQRAALDRADGEAREIIVAFRVETRHFRGLAAEQRAARLDAARGDPLDDVRRRPRG